MPAGSRDSAGETTKGNCVTNPRIATALGYIISGT